MNTLGGYGRNLRGDLIPLPTLARAVELGAALHSSTIAGVATATVYETRAMANPHTLAWLEEGTRVAETVPVTIGEVVA